MFSETDWLLPQGGRWPDHTNSDGDGASASVAVPASPVCVVFGNERDGVSPEMQEQATSLFFLPSAGLTQSFNVSAACAMTLCNYTSNPPFLGFPCAMSFHLIGQEQRHGRP